MKEKDLAFEVIANICSLEKEIIKKAYAKPHYKIFSIPKRSGGKRIIHAPNEETRLVQYKLYENFFRKLSYHQAIHQNIFGGIKKTSILNHTGIHKKSSTFLIKMDLQDAFHHVSQSTLREALYDLFLIEVFLTRYAFVHYNNLSKNEITAYFKDLNRDAFFNPKFIKNFSFEIEEVLRKNDSREKGKNFKKIKKYLGKRYGNHRPVLFRKKNNEEFWKLIIDLEKYDFLKKILLEISSIMAKLLTYNDMMVQGSPTSPTLMALMVSYTNILEMISKKFDTEQVSIYVDDIAISVHAEDKELLQKKIGELIREIEKKTFWKINKKKTRVYPLNKENPLVTGLRLKVSETTKVLEPTLPKSLQKRIRACLHYAQQNPEDMKLKARAGGYIMYTMFVYKEVDKIPSVIKSQLYKYFKTEDLSFLEKKGNKKILSPFQEWKIIEKYKMDPQVLLEQNLW